MWIVVSGPHCAKVKPGQLGNERFSLGRRRDRQALFHLARNELGKDTEAPESRHRQERVDLGINLPPLQT